MMAWVGNPDWAVVLILAGILLIYAEFNRPGTVLFGCAGALAIMLGVWGIGHATVSSAGLGVVALGMVLVMVGCWFPIGAGKNEQERNTEILRFAQNDGELWGVFGVGVAEATCIGWGLVRLTEPRVHWGVAVVVASIFSAVTTWLGRVAMAARRKKQVRGPWDHDWGGGARLGTHFKE